MPRARSQPVPEDVFPDPRIDDIVPAAALPLGEVELTGAHLGPHGFGPPAVLVGQRPGPCADEPSRAPGLSRARQAVHRPG